MATYDIRRFNQATVCEKIRRPASRIIVEERCYTPDPRERAAAQLQAWQVQDDLRREQDNAARYERDMDIARQRAFIEQTRR